jgi:hypothetical protein
MIHWHVTCLPAPLWLPKHGAHDDPGRRRRWALERASVWKSALPETVGNRHLSTVDKTPPISKSPRHCSTSFKKLSVRLERAAAAVAPTAVVREQGPA